MRRFSRNFNFNPIGNFTEQLAHLINMRITFAREKDKCIVVKNYKMKNLIKFCILLCFCPAICQTSKTSPIKSVNIGPTVTYRRPVARKSIPIGNTCKDCSVLAILGQQTFYLKSIKSVTDTLSKLYTYNLVDPAEIKRYTNDKRIKTVMLVQKVPQ